MGQVGRIQHKKVEKGAVKRDRADDRAEGRGPKGRPAHRPAGHKSTQVNGRGDRAGPGDSRAALKTQSKMAPNQKPSAAKPIEDAAGGKVKKAAQATTGYTGTARPRPGAAAKKRDAPRGGALLNAPAPRSGSSKRRGYEDEYDEDMDDFIDYDDEEEEGPRFGYASDGSSDMEAGLDELDVEERRAEYIGRREDVEEDRLEKSLKVAKEERKRKALEDLRAASRRR